jgi:hypothetical protein
LFSLALPVRRLHFFLIRAAMAWAESIVLGLAAALLIPALSLLVGQGVWMSVAGFVILAFGLLLSEIFEGEFTAPVVGLCSLTAILVGYQGHTLRGWNVFDVMSASASIDPKTQLLTGTFPWLGLTICFLVSSVLIFITGAVIQARDF